MSLPRREHERISRVFLRATSLERDRRERYLDRVCRNDPALRREVDSLLAGDDQRPAILRTDGPGLTMHAVRDEPVPKRIGAFRIGKQIGKGGMGVVYRAEQEKPVRRVAAVKLLRRGLESDRILARFELECQALALMNHSNIAGVYEAGVTGDGRPYLAMEYVDGQPITQYCDARRLSIQERLELFLQVCAGVQHAHQRAVIHRDLKPSNVLVSHEDGRAVPRIIDFGIAKATRTGLTEHTWNTMAGELLCTPEYMSPEQTLLRGDHIDTRTDVYGLGVLLYELLSGTRPFEAHRMADSGFDEVFRAIREDLPVAPSDGLRGDPEQAAPAAEVRGHSVKSLRRALNGDLDSIVLRALEKDPARRYDSPSDLAQDIRRKLQGEPVQARKAGQIYRLTRFVQRRKMPVAIATVSVLVLLGFSAFVVLQNRDLVEQRELARAHADLASEQALVSERTRDFAFQLMQLGNEDMDVDAKLRVIDAGLGSLEEVFAAHPDQRAEFVNLTFDAYDACNSDDTCAVLQRALEISMLRTEDPGGRTLQRRYEFGRIMALNSFLDSAEPILDKVLQEQTRLYGAEDLRTLQTRRMLGVVYHRSRRHRLSEETFRQVHDTMARVLGESHLKTLQAGASLASAYSMLEKYVDAESLLRSIHEVSRYGPNPSIGLANETAFNLACVLAAQGRPEEAIDYFRFAMDRGFHWVGNDEHGRAMFGRKGILHIEWQLQPLWGMPEFETIMGDQGYVASLEAAHEADWEKRPEDASAHRRAAVQRGFDPAMFRVRNAKLYHNDQEFRAFVSSLSR